MTNKPVVNQKKKTINNQDHSKYTSYPAAAPLKVFNNLNSTFNSNIKGIRKQFESKKNSTTTGEGFVDKSLYSHGDSTNV